MAGYSEALNPPRRSSQQGGGGPMREDCWSEDATATLVEAWGRRYVELNRGNLRQKDWQEVADAVNSRHGHMKKARRTDVQCKNRIDTLKKKYKVEKARVSESDGVFSSLWPFFSRLDELIGSLPSNKKSCSSSSPSLCLPVTLALPYRKSVVPLKRASPSAPFDDSYFRRSYSAAAAAAAAAGGDSDAEDDDEEEEDSGDISRSSGEIRQKEGEIEGVRRLAQAISRFGEIYERVEGEKQRQMVELEKQRMQFTKDLEFQRMQIFMDTQVQLEKIKRSKRSNGDDMYN